MKTGDYEYFAPCDNPAFNGTSDDVAVAHVQLHELPKALLVQYPFGQNFHYAVRQVDPGTMATISNQTGIPQADVALGIFSGAILQSMSATVDTTSGALTQAYDMVKQALNDALSQNYYQLAKDAYADAQPSSTAVVDQDYYEVTINSSSFHLLNPGGSAVLAAAKQAFATGTSMAAAIGAIAGNMGHVQTLAALHLENEQRAQAAVGDPAFAAFAQVLGADPKTLAAVWLKAAGAAPLLTMKFSPATLALLAGSISGSKPPVTVSNATKKLLGMGMSSARDLPVAPPPAAPPTTAPISISDSIVQLGIGLVGGAAIGALVGSSYDRVGMGIAGGAVAGTAGWFAVRKLVYEEHFTATTPPGTSTPSNP
jgi:hypothetical protein